jgi:hypothetical protein
MSADPRSRAQRRRDTEHRLTHDVDLWVASASADGALYLVPLSFEWDGEALLMATPTDSPIGRNLAASRAVRLGMGHTRDVSVIDGEVEVLEIDALPQELGDRFVARTGFDPRGGRIVPLVWHLPAPDPGLARGERAARPRADARRPLVGLRSRPQARWPSPRASARRRLSRPREGSGLAVPTLLRTLFTGVHERGILRTSALRRSEKFALRVDLLLYHRLGRLSGSYGVRVSMHDLPPTVLRTEDHRGPHGVWGDVLPFAYLGLCPFYLHYVG